MQVFTAHRRDAGLFAEPEILLVKEGFCWPAALFGVLWALWHRMWLTALALFVAQWLIAAAADAAGLTTLGGVALSLGILVFVGVSANDWRRRSLSRRGFDEGPVVAARDRDGAEWRLLQADAA